MHVKHLHLPREVPRASHQGQDVRGVCGHGLVVVCVSLSSLQMIVTFICLGKYLERLTKGETSEVCVGMVLLCVSLPSLQMIVTFLCFAWLLLPLFLFSQCLFYGIWP